MCAIISQVIKIDIISICTHPCTTAVQGFNMHGSNASTPPQRQNTATPLSSLPPVARSLHLLGRLQLCLSVAWSILNVLSPPISNTLARLLILWCATMHVLLAFVVTIMVR